jgi:hypothetical protein
MAPAISAPSFAQFAVLDEIQNTKEQGEGSEKYLTLKKMWLLQPSEIGHLTIAPAIVTYQDPTTNLLKNGKTDVVFADVSAADDQAPVSSQATPSASGAAEPGKPIPWVPLGAIVVGVLLIIVLLLVLAARKPSGSQANYENIALNQLQEALSHVEQGSLDAYYAALSRALLDYLQNKFSLDAHVLSTAVLLERLKPFGISSKSKASLEHFFQVADKAKFGGFVPDEDQMIVLHGAVKDFIEAGRSIKIKAAKPKKKKTDDD